MIHHRYKCVSCRTYRNSTLYHIYWMPKVVVPPASLSCMALFHLRSQPSVPIGTSVWGRTHSVSFHMPTIGQYFKCAHIYIIKKLCYRYTFHERTVCVLYVSDQPCYFNNLVAHFRCYGLMFLINQVVHVC